VGDQLDETTSAASVAVAQPIAEPTVAPSQPMLQYAPESNDDIIRHRGAGSVRLLVPPLRPRDVLRANRWFVVLFSILAIAVVEPYVFGWLRFIVRPLMILIVPVMSFSAGMIGWHMIKCLRHTSIDATAADLMLAVRWPIVGRITTRWPGRCDPRHPGGGRQARPCRVLPSQWPSPNPRVPADVRRGARSRHAAPACATSALTRNYRSRDPPAVPAIFRAHFAFFAFRLTARHPYCNFC
jgi:hypothetical protein